jgi:glycosyltransferase 2 family protein
MPPADALPKPATNSRRDTLRKSALLLLRLAIGVAILVYLAKSGQINVSSLTRIFAVWPVTVAAFGFLLFDIFMMSIRASLLFRSARLSLSLGNSIQLNLIGFLFSTFLPGAAGGDIAKLVYATRENHGRRAEVATVLIVDRLVGLLSLVLLPLLFAPFFLDLLRSVSVLRRILYLDALLAGSMIAGTALFMFFLPARSWVPSLLARWPRIKNLALRVLDAMAVHGKAQGTLLFALLLSILANMALIAVTALALYVVSPVSFSMRLALVAPIGHLVNSIPLTPGGIGVGETAFNALFQLTGISGGAEALLCVRVWNVLVGLLGLLVYLLGLGRIVHPYEGDSGEGDAPMAVQTRQMDLTTAFIDSSDRN